MGLEKVAPTEAPVQSVDGKTGAVNVVYKQDTKPENLDDGDFWVDTSEDEREIRVYNNGSDEFDEIGPSSVITDSLFPGLFG